ncbi:hypothetical protein EVAR_62659_1 [Eumeta japonica]|uniref:Uncharacterized protein n=1 Tax=Eumeta variegata TaxID=151549 RepID=A0A4C1Z3L6_EUMVA|nr:hypothetical protein EVAR_62659_1 [Eumeta japonica]
MINDKLLKYEYGDGRPSVSGARARRPTADTDAPSGYNNFVYDSKHLHGYGTLTFYKLVTNERPTTAAVYAVRPRINVPSACRSCVVVVVFPYRRGSPSSSFYSPDGAATNHFTITPRDGRSSRGRYRCTH